MTTQSTTRHATRAALASTDDTTVSMNPARTAWDADQPGLTPDQVVAPGFGQLFSTPVDGQVYAQPLVIGTTVVVATENNMVYGLHAVTGAVQWTKALGPAWPASAIGCGDLTPTIGVTSTPVYDASSGTVYLTAKVNDGPDVGHPHFYLHALDVATGDERPGWPVTIQGSPANDPGHPFEPFTQHQRAGLLLLDGEVFAGFSGHCDHNPYVGYVVGVKTGTRALRVWATQSNPSPTMSGAGVWMSGGGLVSDGPGRIFLTTGNGGYPPAGPGDRPAGNLGECVIRLAADAGPAMVAEDFFSPANADRLDARDTDLGSGGPVALPSPQFGTAAHPHLMVQVGKDGRVFLLNRDDLGGRSQGPGGTDGVVGLTGLAGGVWGHAAVWGGDGGYVYIAESDGHLCALKYGVSGDGAPVLVAVGQSAETIGHYPGSPVVTSTGTASGTALVWVTCPANSDGTGAQLRAYDAVPVGGVLRLRWSAPVCTAVKFPVAAVAGGRVYVGTRDGRVIAFGRSAQPALTGRPVDFAQVPVGGGAAAVVTVTATQTVTIGAVSATAPFAVAAPPPLPVTLDAGGTLDVPVRFSPTAAGDATASLGFSITVGRAAETIGLDLHGVGTATGFAATPPGVTFGQLLTGESRTLGVIITNTGTTTETVAGATAPAAPFSATGLPTAGMRLSPGASIAIPVTYTPTAPSAAGGDRSTLTVTGTDGHSVGVALTGTAVAGGPHLTIDPAGLDFGHVAVGGTATKTFTVGNTGNTVLTITKAAPPTAPFGAPSPIAEGQHLNPGAVVQVPITFTPTAAGAASGHYLITGDDQQGPQTISLTGTS